MSSASPEILELARRLLAYEAARDNSPDAGRDVALRVIEELRLRLIKLAGVDGFRSLLSRAVTLAKAQTASLNTVQVRADGSLEGLDGIEAGEAGAVLVAHLLELLVTFIGASLTLSVVRGKWPDASIDGARVRTEERA